MTTDCKYCNEAEDKQYRPGLICQNCICFVHLKCLLRPGTPGDFEGDVFFEFTCADCSKDKKEVFKRTRFPWVNVIYLTLFNLQQRSHGISNNGFFHYKTHICSFIDRNWEQLFGNKFKQKKNWMGTIAGALSVHGGSLLQSGAARLQESGWWRAQHRFSPAMAAHILQEMAREKPKGGLKAKLQLDHNTFLQRVIEMGYESLIVHEDEDIPPPAPPAAPAAPAPAPAPPPGKKRRLDSDSASTASSVAYFDYLDNDHRAELTDDSHLASQSTSLFTHQTAQYARDMEAGYRAYDYRQMGLVPPSECSSASAPQSHHEDSDSPPPSPRPAPPSPPPADKHTRHKDKTKEEKPIPIKRESLFSKELNSITMPWLPDEKPEVKKDLVEMSEYEEVQLLKQVEGLIPKVKDANKRAYLRRFRASLALRRLKRHKHLPIFDLEKSVRLLGGYMTEDSRTSANSERVLDRFQRSYLLDHLSGTVAATYGTTVLSRIDPTPLQSPYSGTVLKPYIRRDTESEPLWVKMTEELLLKANKNNPSFVLPPRSPIDYSYIRPQHVAAVNALLAQHFWPGIDVSESLQYPEYSVVASWRGVAVGAALLVPDTRHNEAYISFVITRAHWRRSRVAAFMLYHLLQTCSDKDVTLHCSPTNPAIFMYQKFGFKVEEFIQDFYEKYYDIDYRGCRHALLLRLTR
ncbi:hypothetical protein JYU34_003909 [Plutella xylostella]|uniref:N-acetyltransferase domain-containing protein n=1 Tax=Plutella xylostella TaxID=51655 RepID=A0ABQ7R193_PLUXY|nr:hypothetical protein JYU34_003909 [Plutella xylostella]